MSNIQKVKTVAQSLSRPVVYDYRSHSHFFRDLLNYYKKTSTFSLRQSVSKAKGCSQALVSQIINGKRKLSRNNLSTVAIVLKLTLAEIQYLDKKLSLSPAEVILREEQITKNHEPQNHLLTHWLNPYVKDLVNIKGFALDSTTLFTMLQGLASTEKIKKSLEFLLKEGFLRRTAKGEIVPEKNAVVTTREIPNEKIRLFHQKALEVAMRGIKNLPPSKRVASTVLISIDKDRVDELKGLISSFQQQLLDFIEKNPQGRDKLMQVAIHLTPVGGQNEKF